MFIHLILITLDMRDIYVHVLFQSEFLRSLWFAKTKNAKICIFVGWKYFIVFIGRGEKSLQRTVLHMKIN